MSSPGPGVASSSSSSASFDRDVISVLELCCADNVQRMFDVRIGGIMRLDLFPVVTFCDCPRVGKLCLNDWLSWNRMDVRLGKIRKKERRQSEIRKTSCPSRYAFLEIPSSKFHNKPRDSECERHESYTEKSEPGRADRAGAKQGSSGKVYDFDLCVTGCIRARVPFPKGVVRLTEEIPNASNVTQNLCQLETVSRKGTVVAKHRSNMKIKGLSRSRTRRFSRMLAILSTESDIILRASDERFAHVPQNGVSGKFTTEKSTAMSALECFRASAIP